MAIKPDLSRLTTSQLSELTGVKAQTGIKRLRISGLKPVAEDGRAQWWDPRVAIPVFIKLPGGGAEKSRLDAARADLAELDLRRKRLELVDASDPERAMVSLATMVAGRLQGVGSGIATEVAAETEPSRCQEIIDASIRESLRDLAERGQLAAARLDALLAEDAASDGEGAGGDDAGSEADGSRERGALSDGPDWDESEGGAVEE